MIEFLRLSKLIKLINNNGFRRENVSHSVHERNPFLSGFLFMFTSLCLLYIHFLVNLRTFHKLTIVLHKKIIIFIYRFYFGQIGLVVFMNNVFQNKNDNDRNNNNRNDNSQNNNKCSVISVVGVRVVSVNVSVGVGVSRVG